MLSRIYAKTMSWRIKSVIQCLVIMFGPTMFVYSNIVAAFRGMHVSPVKHSYAWLPRKYQTDGQTDAGQSDSHAPLCFVGDIKREFCIVGIYPTLLVFLGMHVMPAKPAKPKHDNLTEGHEWTDIQSDLRAAIGFCFPCYQKMFPKQKQR